MQEKKLPISTKMLVCHLTVWKVQNAFHIQEQITISISPSR